MQYDSLKFQTLLEREDIWMFDLIHLSSPFSLMEIFPIPLTLNEQTKRLVELAPVM